MKKINLLKPFLLFSLLAVLMTLAACNNPVGNNSSNSEGNNSSNPEPKRYAIWTDRSTYAEFEKVFKTTLKDRHFMWYEFDVEEWNTLSKSLTDKGKYMWTESRMKEWLENEGLSDAQAKERVDWLIKCEHGFIACRDGDRVDYLFK